MSRPAARLTWVAARHAEAVDPAVDPHLPPPEGVGDEGGPPPVVALRLHRRLGPLAAGRADPQRGVDVIMAVGEHVGLHHHRFGEGALGGVAPVVDDGTAHGDDDARWGELDGLGRDGGGLRSRHVRRKCAPQTRL
jgi:hypothetical protein